MNIQDYFCTFVLDPKQNKTKQIRAESYQNSPSPRFFFLFFYLQNCLFLVSIKLKTKKKYQIEFLSYIAKSNHHPSK